MLAVKGHADEVAYFDFQLPLLHSHGHFPIVEETFQFVFDDGQLLCYILAENVDLVLHRRPLASPRIGLCLAGVFDFGFEFRRCRSKEVHFLGAKLAPSFCGPGFLHFQHCSC